MDLLLILSMLKTAGFLVQQVLIDKEKQFYICDEEILFQNTIGYIEIVEATTHRPPFLVFQKCVSYKKNDKSFKVLFKINKDQKYMYNIKYLNEHMYKINSNLSFLVYRTRRLQPVLLREIMTVWMVVYTDNMKAPIKTLRETKKEISKYFKTHKSEFYTICGL